MDLDFAQTAGFPVWSAARGRVAARFVGRGPQLDRAATLAAATGRPLAVAWARQVHSATALEAAPGCGADGDALVSHQKELALCVATADCVPVLLGDDRGVGAIHAGWRGIVAGIVPTALARLGRPVATLATWIGPAIGPCCYEVGWEVAERVAAAAGADVVHEPTPGRRPHLDLAAAVAAQLAAAGVPAPIVARRCTRCSPELWSYRRDGRAAGRNLSFVWLEAAAAGPAGGRDGLRPGGS